MLIKKFEDATGKFMIYEYVRGDLPDESIHKDAEAPEYDAYLKDGVYD
jgi:hypothetical protein